MSKSRALFDLTGSHTSSQVDLTGKTSKKINVSGGPHRFTGKKEICGMYGVIPTVTRNEAFDRFETIRAHPNPYFLVT